MCQQIRPTSHGTDQPYIYQGSVWIIGVCPRQLSEYKTQPGLLNYLFLIATAATLAVPLKVPPILRVPLRSERVRGLEGGYPQLALLHPAWGRFLGRE